MTGHSARYRDEQRCGTCDGGGMVGYAHADGMDVETCPECGPGPMEAELMNLRVGAEKDLAEMDRLRAQHLSDTRKLIAAGVDASRLEEAIAAERDRADKAEACAKDASDLAEDAIGELESYDYAIRNGQNVEWRADWNARLAELRDHTGAQLTNDQRASAAHCARAYVAEYGIRDARDNYDGFVVWLGGGEIDADTMAAHYDELAAILDEAVDAGPDEISELRAGTEKAQE